MKEMLAYKCKFCGALGTAECDPDCPPIDKAAWMPLLCCNRCGSYQSWLRRIADRLSQWAREWTVRSDRDREASKMSTRQSLEALTRKIAEVMCRFYRVDFTWDPDIVNELLAHPHQGMWVVRTFERSIKRLAQQRPLL